MKLLDIAQHIGAAAENVPAELEITGVATLEEAGATELTFLSNPRYTPAAATTRAAAIIVTPEFPASGRPLLRSRNPQLAYAKALELFYTPPPYPAGIHPTAVIAASARIGANASIGAYAVIGEEVEIGANCTILPHVVIYRGARIGDNFFAHAHAVVREFCRLGDNVLLQNGVIIGADGYGFAREGEGWRKIVQSGTAVIGNDVEVQANACVDRATLGETRIGDGCKIDNLVQVGHGSKVGKTRRHLRPGWACRFVPYRQQCDSRGAGGGGGPLQGGRQRDRHRAEWRAERRAGQRDGEWFSGH